MTRRRLAATAAAVVTAAGVALTNAPTASATPHPVKGPPANLLNQADWAMLRSHALHPLTPQPGFSGFAGYSDSAINGNKFKITTTEFWVPRLDCVNSSYGTSNQDVLFLWTGIDGAFGNSVEQDGIVAWCNKGETAPHYAAWYLICCAGPNYTTVPLAGLSAGDHIFADVCAPGAGCTAPAGQYFFEVADITKKTSWTRTQACPSTLTCANSTAEGIFELGTPGGDTVPSQWQMPIFSWASTSGWDYALIQSAQGNGTLDPLAGKWTQNRFNLTDSNNTVLAQVGTLMNGQKFSVTYKNCC